MAKIKVIHNVPDGKKCSMEVKGSPIITSEGHETYTTNYIHCKYRTKSHIPDDKKDIARKAAEKGEYKSYKFTEIKCMMFNKKLSIDLKDGLPFKCDECLRSHVKLR